jgi:hypothetical protein
MPGIIVENSLVSASLAGAVSMQLYWQSFPTDSTSGFPLEFPQGFADLLCNRPATPLNDAQFGGYFFARIWR